ncbi:hypothetical protein FRX31_024953 [Thalictrum thalictroides]|uniref:Uncharacterized protein n=1 Tax=Thalictrum thalictroides TaxID=46969 RepID=A0A7J6VK25_THATH|nr:hypothetical protein FRX31_024953 [Thalictrum thalictroides]
MHRIKILALEGFCTFQSLMHSVAVVSVFGRCHSVAVALVFGRCHSVAVVSVFGINVRKRLNMSEVCSLPQAMHRIKILALEGFCTFQSLMHSVAVVSVFGRCHSVAVALVFGRCHSVAVVSVFGINVRKRLNMSEVCSLPQAMHRIKILALEGFCTFQSLMHSVAVVSVFGRCHSVAVASVFGRCHSVAVVSVFGINVRKRLNMSEVCSLPQAMHRIKILALEGFCTFQSLMHSVAGAINMDRLQAKGSDSESRGSSASKIRITVSSSLGSHIK